MAHGTSQAQESAVFNCIQVNNDGSTTLWFQSPPDVTDLEEYIVYYSTNGSSFTNIVTIPGVAGPISYSHINANSNTGSRYYYIETVYNTESFNSQTLQSIYLQLDNHEPDFNQADLFWNAVSNPLPEASSSQYKIYWDYPGGGWNLMDSTENTTYSTPIVVCLDSINFRIEIENSAGCSSVSNARGNWFKKVEEPDIPFIDSISVDVNGHIIMGWEPVGSAAAYIIYRWESIWNPIDTVYGVNNTFYADTNSNGCIENTAYSVATIDTCGSSGPKEENKERTNMRIDEIIFNVCDESISLNWTKYRAPEPATYEIWFSENGSPFQFAGEVPGSDSVFMHPNVSNAVTYTYYIHTEFPTGSSTTCQKEITTHQYIEPQYIYFANADVLPSQEIELTVDVDIAVPSCWWDVYRTDPGTSTALKVASINRNDLNNNPLVFVDSNVDPSLGSYVYFIKVLDSCSIEKLISNSLETIHLTGEIVDSQSNHMQWTAFEGWDADVEKYYIYRMMGEQEPDSPIDSVGAQTFEFTDDYSSLGNVDGRFVYWIEAAEQAGNTFGYKARSNSNRLNLFLESQMYFANAFKPGGYNPEFKPVSRFFSGTAYNFQIYNRWGQLIFETSDPEAGWSGTYKGEIVEQGVYIYHVSYLDVYSKSTVYRGTVTVIY